MPGRNSAPNVFAGQYVDRRAQMRDQPNWLSNAARAATTRYVALWKTRNLFDAVSGRALLLAPEDPLLAKGNLDDSIYLGSAGTQDYFLIDLEEEPGPPANPKASFDELRTRAALLPADEAGLLSYARALSIWRKRSGFCGYCGSKTRRMEGGHILVCTGETCESEQYPRVDPAIIVLVTDGNRALLGRQASWPKERYSCLAGFVEAGESLEDAVAREVYEEAGVTVRDVEYHSSQPWPFPSSLMLGFSAFASSTRITRIDQELEDVQWFSREEIANGNPILSPGISIAFRLIEGWYNGGSDLPLRQTPGARLWDTMTKVPAK